MSADQFSTILEENPEANVLDVRRKSEFVAEHVDTAKNLPLDFINESMAEIDRTKTYYVHCGSGYRSMTFISILRGRGYENLIDVAGGFNAIKACAKIKTTDYVCPTTLK
jgi:rhodanese-related sulfurtransferase